MNKTGAKIETLFALGGGGQSKFWLQTIANILNMPLSLPNKGELGAALGASRLALAASENIKIEEVMIEPKVEEVLRPTSELVAAYDDAYRIYRDAYPSIKVLK